MKLRNPFKKKSSKKGSKGARSSDVALQPSNDELKNNLPTQQDGRANTPVLEASLEELEHHKAMAPSAVESAALEARLDGSSTGATEDASYKAALGRRAGMEALGGEAKLQRNRARGAFKKGEVSEEEFNGKQARLDRVDGATDALYGGFEDQRNDWVGRRTTEENSGLTSGGVLGAGNAGEVHKVTGKDGVKRVFKGEGAIPMDGARSGIDMRHGMNSSREVLSSKLDEALGSDVITKTSYAEMDGTRGSVMDFAEGQACYSASKTADLGFNEAELAKAQELDLSALGNGDVEEFLTPSGLDYSDPVLQQQLMELQIQDILSAQVDRHAQNYHVAQDDQGKVTGVTGFDNDASFGSEMDDWAEGSRKDKSFALFNTVGLPPLVDESQAARIEALDPVGVYMMVAEHLTEEEAHAAMMRVWELQDHVYDLQARGGVVKAWNDQTFALLMAGDKGSSYIQRDATFQASLQEKTQEFADFRAAQQAAEEAEHEVAELASGQTAGEGAAAAQEPKKKKRGLFGLGKKKSSKGKK